MENSNIGTGEFKLMLSTRAFCSGDVINGNRSLQIMSEPEQIKMLIRSRWWIINLWRKWTKTQRVESTWQYTVKLIEDGTK